MRITPIEHARLMKNALEMLELAEGVIAILSPPNAKEECDHPADSIEEIGESMDDEAQAFRCTLCGTTQKTPFHPE